MPRSLIYAEFDGMKLYSNMSIGPILGWFFNLSKILLCMHRPITPIILLLAVLLATPSFAADIHGTVYDISLREVDSSVLIINTSTPQRFVAKDSTFSIQLPPGDYKIQIEGIIDSQDAGKSIESFKVIGDDSFNLDIILSPNIDEDFGDISDLALPDLSAQEQSSGASPWLLLILSITSLLVLWSLLNSWRSHHKGEDHTPPATDRIPNHEPSTANHEPNKDYPAKILTLLKENDGRMTQKDIRSHLPLSEAKVSLLISQLEHEGKIQSFKKGRGNIIILKR